MATKNDKKENTEKAPTPPPAMKAAEGKFKLIDPKNNSLMLVVVGKKRILFNLGDEPIKSPKICKQYGVESIPVTGQEDLALIYNKSKAFEKLIVKV